jgi:hypothetical protein
MQRKVSTCIETMVAALGGDGSHKPEREWRLFEADAKLHELHGHRVHVLRDPAPPVIVASCTLLVTFRP